MYCYILNVSSILQQQSYQDVQNHDDFFVPNMAFQYFDAITIKTIAEINTKTHHSYRINQSWIIENECYLKKLILAALGQVFDQSFNV